MFDFCFPNGLFAYRPAVCGRTIGWRLMYRSRPLSRTTTSATSYRSNNFSGYDGRFLTAFFFGFSGGGGTSPSGGSGSGAGGTPSGSEGTATGSRGGGGTSVGGVSSVIGRASPSVPGRARSGTRC